MLTRATVSAEDPDSEDNEAIWQNANVVLLYVSAKIGLCEAEKLTKASYHISTGSHIRLGRIDSYILNR